MARPRAFTRIALPFGRLRAVRQRERAAFTLIELLVVVAIIALLMSILLPSLQRARDVSKMTVCLSNQRQIGLAIVMYLEKWDRRMLPTRVPADARNGHDLWDKALAREMNITTVTDWGWDKGGREEAAILLCPSQPINRTRFGPKGQPFYGSYGLHRAIGWPGEIGYNPNQGIYRYQHWDRGFVNASSHQGPRQPATLPVLYDAEARRVLNYNYAYDHYAFFHRHVTEGDGSNFLFADGHGEYLRADKSITGGAFFGATELTYPGLTW